ncbi:hypothetical protein GCM10008909_10210 [Hathewaya limosa]
MLGKSDFGAQATKEKIKININKILNSFFFIIISPPSSYNEFIIKHNKQAKFLIKYFACLYAYYIYRL